MTVCGGGGEEGQRWHCGQGSRMRGGRLTSLVVELFENLANDLADTL